MFKLSDFRVTEIAGSNLKSRVALLMHKKKKKQLFVTVESIDGSVVTCRETSVESGKLF